MAIVGVGVDVVDIARLRRALTRTPRLAHRLFTDAERDRPVLALHGSVAAEASAQGIRTWHLSLSHDGGVATAVVVAES